MKYIFIVLVIIVIISCQQKDHGFEPIETVSELSDSQIDSILTKFNFRYENPILLDSTDKLIIPISTELLGRRNKFSIDGYYSNDFPRFWNILFYDKSTGTNRLLTKEKTRITQIHVNRNQFESETMKSIILYELTQIDYNKDGKLNSKDPEFLFASDLNGENLVQISPKNEDLKHFEVLPNSNQIILRTTRDTKQDSIFNNEDESILYKGELKEAKWELSEIIDSSKRNEIEKLYLNQWLSKSK